MRILHLFNHILRCVNGVVNVAIDLACVQTKDCYEVVIAILDQIGAVNITPEAHALILWNFLGSGLAAAIHDRAYADQVESS
jgi:hypothetical protein